MPDKNPERKRQRERQRYRAQRREKAFSVSSKRPPKQHVDSKGRVFYTCTLRYGLLLVGVTYYVKSRQVRWVTLPNGWKPAFPLPGATARVRQAIEEYLAVDGAAVVSVPVEEPLEVSVPLCVFHEDFEGNGICQNCGERFRPCQHYRYDPETRNCWGCGEQVGQFV
jgi:hypothetical protein